MSLTYSTDAPTTTDRATLVALSCGDDAAWRSTVRRYEGLLRGSARAILRNDSDVDEAVQRTWVQLFRHADRIHDGRGLPGWLSTTARREALAVLRSQQRAVPTEDVADRVSPVDADLAGDLMRRELSEALGRAVDRLPATQRRLVQAMLREEQSYDTLSRELNMPRGSLGPLRGRAVRTLRAQLEPSLR